MTHLVFSMIIWNIKMIARPMRRCFNYCMLRMIIFCYPFKSTFGAE